MREIHVGNDERSGGKPTQTGMKRISNVVEENIQLKKKLQGATKAIEELNKMKERDNDITAILEGAE